MSPESPRRPVRSYVLRGGRMGPGQQRAIDELGPLFVLPFESRPLDLAAAFGRRGQLGGVAERARAEDRDGLHQRAGRRFALGQAARDDRAVGARGGKVAVGGVPERGRHLF
ncbi:MAG: hypothetical protein ACLGI6_23670, partial [Gammaproteobacteria bacterium]